MQQNIQAAINKYIELHKDDDDDEYKTVELERREDYDFIEYQNCIVEFPPGGKIGDDTWALQYFHNVCVSLERQYKQKRKTNPSYSPETYIILKNDELEKIKSVDIEVNGLLLSSYQIEIVIIAQKSYDLTPLTFCDTKELFPCDEMYFIELYKDLKKEPVGHEVKRYIVYKDGTKKEIPDNEIYELKY